MHKIEKNRKLAEALGLPIITDWLAGFEPGVFIRTDDGGHYEFDEADKQTFRARLNLQLHWRGHTVVSELSPTRKQLIQRRSEFKRLQLKYVGQESFPYGRARLFANQESSCFNTRAVS
ncbi:MAG: hypothetical protein COA78_12035 [Blastopirellula sp.]|nr:MAG: hypothetical protein COA78_12035 [Blastopirellula sp.]